MLSIFLIEDKIMTDQNNIDKNYATQYIGKTVEVTMDRPLHSKHPKFEWEYKLNYGYVPGTHAPDGEEIDAYILRVDQPLDTFTGKCVAVIHRSNDKDDKLVVVPADVDDVSDEEIRESTHFQEQFFESEILRGTID